MPILLIAIVFFVVLLIAGLYLEELSWKQVIVWVVIAVVAYVGLGWFVDESMNLFSAALAVIDVVLAIIIFKEYVGRL
jgi:predicted aminopeptidase